MQVTFIYGYNDAQLRKALWKDIVNLSMHINDPWICLGDFNVSLNVNERHSKAAPNLYDIEDFSNCLCSAGLTDIPFTGPLYTWSNNQFRNDRVWAKLDRVLGNDTLLQVYPNV